MSDIFEKTIIRSQAERIEILEDENANLQQCYCNRTDCSGRIRDSRKYDSLQQKYNKALNDLAEESHKRIELEKENKTIKARQEIGKTCGLCPYYHYKTRCEKAIDIAYSYAQIDGAHHKMWTIDKIARALLGDDYEKFIKEYEEDGEYTWDTGIAP